MNSTQRLRVLIAGGYGMIGGNVARQLRERFPQAEIWLGGRRPERAQALAEELAAKAVKLDLESGRLPDEIAGMDIIVSAVPDPCHLLGEFAIRSGAAFINITATGDAVLPLMALANQHAARKSVVPLGYYEAGLLLPLVYEVAKRFERVESVVLTALHDPDDALGQLSTEELSAELAPALMREKGVWLHSAGAREVVLENGVRTEAVPFATLDIPAVAAMTGAHSVRLGVAGGESFGTRVTGKASMDLYVDIKGSDASGAGISRRLVASDPQGQAHFTALGVMTVIEAILWRDGKGFTLPEQLLDFAPALHAMQQAGVQIRWQD
ncbi:hypothetical protein EGM70_22315 [Enterobacteriaceae bacterium 89]|nr:hypothetical protein [Enterobacteriaceae bacterium 89]